MSKDLMVIKYGSETVTGDSGPKFENIDAYAAEHATLMADDVLDDRNSGLDVITVTSGAVALGKMLWKDMHGDEYPKDPQPLALLGIGELAVAWQKAYKAQGLLAGLILTTQHELEDISESTILQRALSLSLKLGIIPVVNENDALSAKELHALARGADNDRLARFIAQLMNADILCLMTNVDGVEDEQGKIVKEVPNTADAYLHVSSLVRPIKSGKGRNGMDSKITEARIATNLGIETHIANANASVKDVIAGLAGTHFVAKAINGVE